MVAGALEGIGSTRELLRQASVRLDLRRFLGYGLGERLPVHQTLSHAHTRRFVDAALFERLFLRSLELCKQTAWSRAHICRSTASTPRRTQRLRACARASPSRPRRRPRRAMTAEPGGVARPGPAGQLALEERPAGGQPGGERPPADAGRTALRPDAEAAELERDLCLCDRSGGEAARQARVSGRTWSTAAR